MSIKFFRFFQKSKNILYNPAVIGRPLYNTNPLKDPEFYIIYSRYGNVFFQTTMETNKLKDILKKSKLEYNIHYDILEEDIPIRDINEGKYDPT